MHSAPPLAAAANLSLLLLLQVARAFYNRGIITYHPSMDWYSYGVLLLLMLVSHRPDANKVIEAALILISCNNIMGQQLLQNARGGDARVVELVVQLLQRDAGARPLYGEVKVELERVDQELQAAAAGVAGVEVADEEEGEEECSSGSEEEEEEGVDSSESEEEEGEWSGGSEEEEGEWSSGSEEEEGGCSSESEAGSWVSDREEGSAGSKAGSWAFDGEEEEEGMMVGKGGLKEEDQELEVECEMLVGDCQVLGVAGSAAWGGEVVNAGELAAAAAARVAMEVEAGMGLEVEVTAGKVDSQEPAAQLDEGEVVLRLEAGGAQKEVKGDNCVSGNGLADKKVRDREHIDISSCWHTVCPSYVQDGAAELH